MGRFEVLRSTVLFFLLMITSTQATPFADPPSSQNGHFFQKSLLSAIGAATYQLHASSTFMKIIHNSHKHNRSDDGVQITKAAADCLQLLDHTAEELLWVFEVAALGRNRLRQHRSNLNAWLSASMTNQETCLEEFEQTREEKTKIFVRALLNMMIEKLESILSMVKGAIAGGGGPLPYSVPPGWLAKRDIKLLMSRLEDANRCVSLAAHHMVGLGSSLNYSYKVSKA
ncbi:hypothetical protein H6P81_004266 [Aristolochia fimbriata]|uniref:Pectinesterase inhibitor domain-containing protein n=1 Tax=Aristolochia fimbriata TaxID=158543 RepID=A0AAV7FF31_ARIFI|nr:hypothetical protein H6P81_004266 [Aristolochia fimbriata]